MEILTWEFDENLVFGVSLDCESDARQVIPKKEKCPVIPKLSVWNSESDAIRKIKKTG